MLAPMLLLLLVAPLLAKPPGPGTTNLPQHNPWLQALARMAPNMGKRGQGAALVGGDHLQAAKREHLSSALRHMFEKRSWRAIRIVLH